LRRISPILLCLAAVLFVGNSVYAQMGMNIFQKPSIADIFHPVVGGGAAYQVTHTDSPNAPPKEQQLSVVGKEVVDGQDAYWMEFSEPDKSGAGSTVGKILVNKSDFQMHRMIFQKAEQPAMEIVYHPDPKDAQSAQNEINKMTKVGTETITVPAGTFSCVHWKNDSGDNIWVSDKVTPFGMVKQMNKSETRVLLKLITDAKDQITGPVKTFDPTEMQRQMMEKRKQQQPN
jgi:hypothetical protein